jgi:hypothetical protein
LAFSSRTSRKIGGFRICLRADRDIFTSRHCHRACDKPGGTRHQALMRLCGISGHADDEAGG